MSESDTGLVAQERQFSLPAEAQVESELQAVSRFRTIVHKLLREGEDYGSIKEGMKPSMWQPGAQKIIKIAKVTIRYIIEEQVEQWDVPVGPDSFPLFSYRFRCEASWNGRPIDEGWGSANSYEAKYRWREGKRKCPECGQEAIIKGLEKYGGGWVCWKKRDGCDAKWKDGDQVIESQDVGMVPNEAVYDQVNTLLKMAKKRSLVDVSLSIGSLSDVFTQDIEDMPAGTVNQSATATKSADAPSEPPQEAQNAPETDAPITSGPLDYALFWEGCKEKGLDFAQVVSFLGAEPREWIRGEGRSWDAAWQTIEDKLAAEEDTLAI